jgi:hypothetical protein
MSGFFDDLCGDPAVAEAMEPAEEAGNVPSPPPGSARGGAEWRVCQGR